MQAQPTWTTAALARLRAHIREAGPSECWEWTGDRNHHGYGVLNVASGAVMAHRVSWEASHNQRIPDGLVIDHLCRNRGCVNPAHLEPVTTLENNLRGMQCQRGRANRSRIAELHKLGFSNAAIGREIGISAQTVGEHMKIISSEPRP